jgi:hypothetical protein
MQNGKSLLSFGFMIAISVVLSTYLVTDAMRDIRMSHQIIKVRGYAETPVQSDLAKWNISVRASDKKIAEAYHMLATDRAKVLNFLKSNGLKDADVQIGSVTVSELKKRSETGQLTNETETYLLSQTIGIKCTDVSIVAKASTKIPDLLGEGVELHAHAPMYYYTQVNELKSALLVNATKDARERAKTLAEGSGVRLGPLRAARQGVFSVRAADSTGISESSSEDTSSIGKKVAAVVTVDYAMK